MTKTFLSRRALLQASALAATCLASTLALAQQWPAKPISLVVPFPPGGSSDVLARAMTDKLSQALGQTVIVESWALITWPSRSRTAIRC
jgi:tripartite-type tricarboxylate transporter receptor subunit TctC